MHRMSGYPAGGVAGETELNAGVTEVLLAAGWRAASRGEYDDGQSLVGERIFADGHGVGVVLGFNKATVGTSTHLVRLDVDASNVEVKLERKGNKQTRWLLAPPPSDAVGTPRSNRQTMLQLLLAPPPPLPGVAARCPALQGNAEGLCTYCDVESTLAVAELLAEQLVLCTSAASRMLSAVQPAVVRSELETALLGGQADAGAPVAETVRRLCEEFAKGKATFGGRFSSKDVKGASAELRDSCTLAWPYADRLAMARWLHWAHDPPPAGGEPRRQRSCWHDCTDAAALAEHQAQCPFLPQACPNAAQGCDVLLPAASVAAHDAECGYKPIPCVLGCGVEVRRSEMEAHINGDCGERIVNCSWADLGCDCQVKQSALPAHEEQASAAHLALAREALLAQQMLTADLAARNAELRATAELQSESLAALRAEQVARAQAVSKEVAETLRSERASSQAAQAEAEAAAKSVKALEKEVKALRKQVTDVAGLGKEMAELRRTVAELQQR